MTEAAADRLFPVARAGRWRLKTRSLELPRCPLLMGIVNVTPDSFSDGGRLFSGGDQLTHVDAAVAYALGLEAAGAAIIDIGGESTRPYAEPVALNDEARRVIPVIEQLRGQLRVPISIDTTKPAIAEQALRAGAEIINDVSGLGDPAMLRLAAETGAGVCAMHMQGTPQTMQDSPRYDDVVHQIHEYLRQRRDALQAAGIERERIALDPGIGFGKTHQHNLTLLAQCGAFLDLGCPVLVGPSRKGFIAKIIGDKTADRTAGTIGVALALARQGVQVLRVHDVAAVRQALRLFEAVGGIDGGVAEVE